MKPLLVLALLASTASAAWKKDLLETTCQEWRFEMTSGERFVASCTILRTAVDLWKKETGKKETYVRGDCASLADLLVAYCQGGGEESIGRAGLRFVLSVFSMGGRK